MRRRYPGPEPRRGLTLLEMLVVVALVVLIMTILVTIFQAATGAMIASRAYQELNEDLRRLDTTIRQDLDGATAKFTPPLDPREGLGYFEYGENARADLQGEDVDDTLAFTARAPEGQPFTGRLWVNSAAPFLPIQVTSQYAEIIYFLRNGNLYRRVLLIKPEIRRALLSAQPIATSTQNMLGFSASWQGVNDISARPSMTGTNSTPIPNTLSDLTNRQNRFARPRFSDDFLPIPGSGPDGFPDDVNNNGVPDRYPTLYPNAFNVLIPHPGADDEPLVGDAPGSPFWPGLTRIPAPSYDTMAFPYVFPWAYSKSFPNAATPGGFLTESPNGIHVPVASLDPGPPPGQTTTLKINHAPLAAGLDNWYTPDQRKQQSEFQTWWAFPTWRETASLGWEDPAPINQPNTTPFDQPQGLSWDNRLSGPANQHLPWGEPLPDFSDGTTNSLAQGPFVTSGGYGWDDDLIMTNVRSFDIKALDPQRSNYVDLGYLNLDGNNPDSNNSLVPKAAGVSSRHTRNEPGLKGYDNTLPIYNFLAGFGHEGRIPPLEIDYRVDPQYPQDHLGVPYWIYDNAPSVIRLQRVFDTWSTNYTRAPAIVPTVNPDFELAPDNRLLTPPYHRSFYPSFPPPYDIPLRGLQIQIRVADPRGERLRILTIRQDFSDKL